MTHSIVKKISFELYNLEKQYYYNNILKA